MSDSDSDRPLAARDLSAEEARARAVAVVLAEQAARRHARRRREPGPSTTWRRVVAMVVFYVAALYVWFAAPVWLSPAPPPPIPPERVDAGLRMAIYLEAQKVQLFRDDRGRLPDDLEETGEPLPGIHYDRIDARTFRLRAAAGGESVVYESTDSLDTFARDAARIVGLSP